MVLFDTDAENGYKTHSLHLRFVTIASIIFKKENADVDAKCEWVLAQHNFHSQMNIERKIVSLHLDVLAELTL